MKSAPFPAVTRRHLRLTLSLMALLLVTAAAWRWQFQAAAPRMPVAFGPDHRGWTVKAPQRIGREGDLWVLPAVQDGISCGAETALTGLDGYRHLHVVLDAAWEEIERKDGRSWHSGRLSLAMRGADGRSTWPADGDLVNAERTRARHRVERVLDLPQGGGVPHLVLVNLAERGTLKVGALEVTPVQRRRWVPVAAVGVVGGWFAWFAAALGGLSLWRRVVTAAMLTVAGALLVFPQPQYHAFPLPGGFSLGPPISPLPVVPPPPVAVPAVVAPRQASPPQPPATPKVEPRVTHAVADTMRKVDHDLPLAHLLAFCAVGLALAAVAGARIGGCSALALAILSEVVPNVMRGSAGLDDVGDLAANLMGVALSVAITAGCRRYVPQRIIRPRQR